MIYICRINVKIQVPSFSLYKLWIIIKFTSIESIKLKNLISNKAINLIFLLFFIILITYARGIKKHILYFPINKHFRRKLQFSNFVFEKIYNMTVAQTSFLNVKGNSPLHVSSTYDRVYFMKRRLSSSYFCCRYAYENSIVSTICGRNLKFCWRSSRDYKLYLLRVSAHWSVLV